MKGRNKRWTASSVTIALLFAIGAIRFYSLYDGIGKFIYGTAGFAFPVISCAPMGVS